MSDRLDGLYTLHEAADATGLTIEALRQRIKRGTLRAVRGNDRLVRVRLDADQLKAMRPGQPTGPDLALREALTLERERANQAAAEVARLAQRAERTGRAEAEAVREALARERGARQAAEEGLEAARTEIMEWTAGGPLARAVRALLHRRGRP